MRFLVSSANLRSKRQVKLAPGLLSQTPILSKHYVAGPQCVTDHLGIYTGKVKSFREGSTDQSGLNMQMLFTWAPWSHKPSSLPLLSRSSTALPGRPRSTEICAYLDRTNSGWMYLVKMCILVAALL